MAVGRITGPLLAANLNRDGIPLAIDGDLIFWDVGAKKIGIRNSAPKYELDVNGTINAFKIIANTGTIGLVNISSSTTGTSLIETLYGPLVFQPGGEETITLIGDTLIDGNLHVTGNITADGDIVLGDNTTTDTVIFGSDIKSDFIPFNGTGTVVTTGTLTYFVTNTSVVSEFSLGSTESGWLSGYIQDIYTKRIDTIATGTDIQFFPDIPLLERTINKTVTINGDIRVYGGSPIGTFPVVNNVLFVNENGNDDNDGRAMDSSRACRTITGATRSPFYKEGTIIKVAAGKYLEDNPIQLKPYTTVMGDSLRTTFIEPLNNTVDLFHVNSGVYVAQMTMLNLRRGEVTRYSPGGAGTYTTGAYAVAFPPRLDNPIDLFHSPYIQNCTNQSGPWLFDGTMFVPNQTVQVPQVVATSTYVSGTTTLLVNVLEIPTTQMLEIGMAVNGAGILINPDIPVAVVEDILNPDPDFQSANSLIVSNKSFLQSEAVAYVDLTFPALTYDRVKFRRDAGVIIDAIVHDAVLGGNTKIVSAGRQYSGSATTASVAGFTHLASVINQVVDNLPVSVTFGNVESQTFNLALTGGAVVAPKVTELVQLLNDIILNNSSYENAAALLNANRGFLQNEVVSFVNQTYVGQPLVGFSYDKDKCFRDTGFIIDALAQDLLYGGNEQSVYAGNQYWDGVTSLIPTEQEETIAAFNYLANVARNVILGKSLLEPYQSTVTQYINTLTIGNNASAEIIEKNVLALTDIISLGTDTTIVVQANSGSPTTVPGTLNSYQSLVDNKEFIQHEIVAFVDTTFTKLDFIYNAAKCYRDTGIIVDSLAIDLIYESNSNSAFSGLQYWNQAATNIPGEEPTTIGAFTYLRDIVADIIQGIPISPLQIPVQQNTVTTGTSSLSVVDSVTDNCDLIINIITTGTVGITDLILGNGDVSTDPQITNAHSSLIANKSFIQAETIAWVEANKPSGFVYDSNKCSRDAGFIVDCIAVDLLRGGNRQSIQAGVSYFGYNSTSTVLVNEIPQTTAAYKYLKFVVDKVVQGTKITDPYQSTSTQNINLPPATKIEADSIVNNLNLITDIIRKGPSVAPELTSVGVTYSTSTNLVRAFDLLKANREFIQSETIAYVDKTFIDPYVFTYNEDLCYRDVGLIVDAISNDIINRSNVNTLIAGKSYWNGAVSVIPGQLKETANAIRYAKNVALDIISNNPVTYSYQTGTVLTQLINPLLPGGALATPLVESNFNAISTIIENGPEYTPFSTNSTLTQFIVTLSTSTIASANNDVVYFGETTVYPVENKNIPGEWEENGFADRRIDPNGAGGGALVDGNAPSLNSPIQSFVFDAFTQLNQGGTGIHIINRGYAQLVSVFTIFCDIAVRCESGGICSITNSNANFGDLCLVAEGYGPREFGGTVYNPSGFFYNKLTKSWEYSENYPEGFFPNKSEVCIFVPDPNDRPHIALVMEVVPPDIYNDYDGNVVPYKNEQGYPGFLAAVNTTGTLSTGSYSISGIDTTGFAIGQNLYIRDQFGNEADNNGEGTRYLNSNTIITDISYQTIQLSNPITATGFEPGNENYFNLYACGNAYYTVLTSEIATSPYASGASKIRGQENETIDAINFMNSVVDSVISNTTIDSPYSTATAQVINLSYPSGVGATTFVDEKLSILTGVILSGPQSAPAVLTTGTIPIGAKDAIALLELNRIFIMNETVGYVDAIYNSFTYDQAKCERDTGLIVDSIALDLLHEGFTQSQYAGIQYWNQSGLTGGIEGELTTTSNAIAYARDLAVSVVTGYGSTNNTVSTLFNTILDILGGVLVDTTNAIVPNGPTSSVPTIVNAYNALLAAKSDIQTQTIAWINANNAGFTYDQATCERDLGYIVDSVAFDLIHSGNRQSIQAGSYYYSFGSNVSAIPNEIPQTTAAYNFIKSIIGDIITGTPTSPSYQNQITQTVSSNPGTVDEVNAASARIDLITTIINNGPGITPATPISLTASTSSNVINAYNLITANRDYIKAEVIAYIDNEYGGFTYDRLKCRRDVGLIIDALQADLATGGNFRSVEAAKTYYTKDGTYHLVSMEEYVANPLLFVDGCKVNFYQRSYMSASGYLFEYVGAGTNYGALPQVGRVDPNQSKETVQLNNGKVFFTSTDQNGDFRIGPGLVISQATGVLSGRTFQKSLFAEMTPFILAVEADAGG